jgi:phage portal protein BeeE
MTLKLNESEDPLPQFSRERHLGICRIDRKACAEDESRVLWHVSLRSGGLGRALFEGHFAFLCISVYSEGVAGVDFAVEQLHGERVLDEPLDGALQRPRPEPGTVAFLENQIMRLLQLA